MYNTRIAPSPTGNFHIGTARTAYFNWLAARASGGKFILRIDDTDPSRTVDGALEGIHKSLDWLGLDVDEVYTQSERLDIYNDVAEKMLDAGSAIRADNGAVLLNRHYVTTWVDAIAGTQTSNQNDIDLYGNQVLIKADGMPIYHFATVVDDIDMDINYVIRGADHFTNTYRHAIIYDALLSPKPTFAHIGLIMHNKKKMSKRDAAASLLGYKDAGYEPGAILETLLRIGWGPKIDDKSNKFIDRDRALELFLNEGNLKANPSTFDLAKMDFFNKVYRRRVQSPS
jgi:glutamyl/glutaminyl-tRNA synthetase